jgi:steroid delta-isomerase-like uncharacterized protein
MGMPAAENKALMRRYYDEVWQQGNMAAADALVAPTIVDHMPLPGQAPGRAGHHQAVMMILSAFPDHQFSIEDLVAEEDRVVGRWTMRATHTGELMGIPVTGKPVTMSGIDIARFANGQIAEVWHIEDVLGMMQQLGVIPALGPAPTGA